MSTSPYKKLRVANREWVSYVNISQLSPHIGYRILGIVATNHEKYGPGQQAHLAAANGSKYRTQLPGKYLRDLKTSDIEVFKSDARGQNPYLIFREKLPDNSYRIDILEKSESNDKLYTKAEPFPELAEEDLEGEEGDDKEGDDKLHEEDQNGDGANNLHGEDVSGAGGSKDSEQSC